MQVFTEWYIVYENTPTPTATTMSDTTYIRLILELHRRRQYRFLILNGGDPQRHLRASSHIVHHERCNEPSGEAQDPWFVLGDGELEMLDELDEDRLHLDDPVQYVSISH